jgi:tRNA dimethylallyltransferase
MNKTCLIIAGPTAAGKTDLSIQTAKYLSTDIISADSRQCYKELNIGVAKPDDSQLAAIHHYFINSHSIHEPVSAAGFETYALNAAEIIFKKSDFAVMVGGTGLYIKAFCEGLDPIPPVDPLIRQNIQEAFKQEGIDWLRNEIETTDPEFFQKGETDNPQRMMRALEVMRSTGKSVLFYRTGEKRKRDFNIIKIGLELTREELYARIDNRVDQMIGAGLVEEVRALIPFQSLTALQTVGYRELFSYFNNELTFDKAVNLIKQNSRHYAKRQMTWFKRDPEIKWIRSDEGEIIKEFFTK